MVYKEDKMVLYRYKEWAGRASNKTPLLIVYALVNRPYMADLQENRSTIRVCWTPARTSTDRWGYPDAADRYLTMDDYINGYLDRRVDVICAASWYRQAEPAAGHLPGRRVQPVLIRVMHPKRSEPGTMVTPVDFKTPDNMLSHWVQNVDIDLLVDTQGNIPGEMLNWTFLNPALPADGAEVPGRGRPDGPKALKNFMRMENGSSTAPDQAGETFRQFTKDFFQQNKLMKGEVQIGEYTVDLRKVNMPVLNVFAEQDHLVPPDASRGAQRWSAKARTIPSCRSLAATSAFYCQRQGAEDHPAGDR